jgi:hypothetical protein
MYAAGSEAGMLTRGRMYAGCHDVGWYVRCAAVQEDCVALISGCSVCVCVCVLCVCVCVCVCVCIGTQIRRRVGGGRRGALAYADVCS